MKLLWLALAGAALLFATGCAGMQMKVKTSSGVVVPLPECVGKVLSASPDSFCAMLPEPQQMECIGKFRMTFNCWKVRPK